MDTTTREKCVLVSKIAQLAKRFDEMVVQMRKVAQDTNESTPELSFEERNLLSIAYKNIIGSRRESWRTISSIEQLEKRYGHEKNAAIALEFRIALELESKQICRDIIDLLVKNLIPSAKSGETKVFYYKMKADFYRYLAEFSVESERLGYAQNSLEAYNQATSTAVCDLVPTHPIRLGLALNFSVFYYEIMNSTEKACSLAKQAFDESIAELDSLTENSFIDTSIIMQLLRDNLAFWTGDIAVEEDEELDNTGEVNEVNHS